MKNKRGKKSFSNDFFNKNRSREQFIVPKNRRGELTTQQIVILIVLIVSFIVILFLLLRLNLGQASAKDICHNSVVLKSQSVLKSETLDCKTTYVCISQGNKCTEITPTVTVKVITEEQIVKAIQEEIDDCAWMFGKCEQGKPEIDYGALFGDLEGFHCAICSVIKFDDKIQSKFPLIKIGEKEISTSEKYSVFTGLNPGLKDNSCIEAQIVKSSDIESKTECDTFDVTKA